ncbi:MAG: chemotaxis protein CheW, partial [Leptolyngbya sp. SIO1D8]|nr:chemotaxis protein CheW [Leptolyngbya sp. SIO1D8]
MTQHALVRVRHAQPKEPMLRFITFQLRHHWFCLPLASARRVLPQQPEMSMGMGLIHLQDEAIPVVDTATLVYGSALPQLPGQVEESSAQQSAVVKPIQSILVVDLAYGGAAGLLVDGTPGIKRVRQSALNPVPPMYLSLYR